MTLDRQMTSDVAANVQIIMTFIIITDHTYTVASAVLIIDCVRKNTHFYFLA